MKLTLAEPQYLVEPISIISELVTEVKLKLEKDKLEIVAMDPANVAMIIFTLLRFKICKYKVINRGKKVIRRLKSNELKKPDT